MKQGILPLTPSRSTISAFVICYNEEVNIRRCLDSVSWCDEIIVVDSGSTDKTLEICRDFTERIYSRSWPGFVEQKRYALSLCNSEWVLNIDADEVVTPALKKSIYDVLLRENSQFRGINGCQLSRVVFHLGKWWRKGGWYPEYRLRLARRNFTRWGGDNPHEKALVQGKTIKLEGELQHYTYSNLDAQVAALNRFSTAAALTLQSKGEQSSVTKIFFRPASRFIKFYFLKRGFLEGLPGLIVACLETYYVFLKYVKLWELRRSKENSPIS